MNDEKEIKKVSMILNLSNTEIYIFLGVGLALILLPLLFTWDSISWISFKDKGEIGDTIGGITAPFIGFGGSILVYLALKAQIDANEQVRMQFKRQEKALEMEKKLDYYKNRVLIIQQEVNNFSFTFNDDSRKSSPKYNYEGSQAILKLLDKSKDSFYGKKERTPYQLEPKLVELRSLLVFFEITILEVRNDIVIDTHSKSDIANILKYIFEAKINGNFKKMEDFKSEHNTACPNNCGNFHGIPSDLFDLVESIKVKIDATM